MARSADRSKDASLALLLLRVGVGLPFAAHGFQKLFGWFGGGGFDGTAGWFESLGFGDGKAATAMAGGSEIAGGLGLAAGAATPAAAGAMIGTMTTAAFVNNADNGFWSVKKGWELNGYLILVAAAVAGTGPGRYSVDHALGLENLSGKKGMLGALAAGIGGGTLRWVTRKQD